MNSAIRSQIALNRAQIRVTERGTSAAAQLSEVAPHPNWAMDGAPGWSYLGTQVHDHQYESLSGVPREHLLKILTKLYRTNGLAKSLMTLTVGFAVGGEIKFKANNRRVQYALDRFWKSDYNDWGSKLFSRVRDWRLYGEQIWPAYVNPMDGFVQIGYINPINVKAVTTDEDDLELLRQVILYSKDGVQEGRRYNIIHPVQTPAFREQEKSEGDVFFLRANPLTVDSRGYSDLLTMADWFAALEDLVFTSVERSAQSLQYKHHVKVENVDKIDPDTERELQRKFSGVKPGSIVVTPDNVKLDEIMAKLGAAETSEEARTVVNMISGASNMPAAWLGFGEDFNRATLDKINGPTIKMLDQVRRDFHNHIKRVGKYVIMQAQAAGYVASRVDPSFEVEMPSIAEEDSREWARAIAQITTAAMLANRNGFITLETGSKMIKQAVEQIGVAYDPAEEVASREKEQDKLDKMNRGDTANPAKDAGKQTSTEQPGSTSSQ